MGYCIVYLIRVSHNLLHDRRNNLTLSFCFIDSITGLDRWGYLVMHPKIKKILPQIEYWLSCKEIAEFKIGFTCDINRREKEHIQKGFDKLYPIARSKDIQIIRQAEIDLINYFKTPVTSNPDLVNKCKNDINKAGTGDECNNEDNIIFYLYIVVKFSEDNITEPADTHVESLLFNNVPLIEL